MVLKEQAILVATNYIKNLNLPSGIYSVYFKVPVNLPVEDLEVHIQSEVGSLPLVKGSSPLFNKEFSIYTDTKQNSKNPEFLHFMGFGKL